MDFEKRGLGSFLKDMGKTVFVGPERVEQPKPVKRENKGAWGDTKMYLSESDIKRGWAKKDGPKFIMTPDGRPIRLTWQERAETLKEGVLGGKRRAPRPEASKNIRLALKKIKADRFRSGKPSEISKAKEKEKLLKMFVPGPRVLKPGFGRGFWNSLKMAAGKDPDLSGTSLDASTIKQNTPEIKK